MLLELSNKEKEEAVNYLIKNIPRSILDKAYQEIKKEEEYWYIAHHFSFGMYVRNLLRRGKFDWDDIILDDYWHILIEEAVEKVFGKKLSKLEQDKTNEE
jgi:hypothetical protein